MKEREKEREKETETEMEMEMEKERGKDENDQESMKQTQQKHQSGQREMKGYSSQGLLPLFLLLCWGREFPLQKRNF